MPATISFLSFDRVPPQGTHRAAGKLHLATSIRQDPGPGLTQLCPDRLRSARLVALVCLIGLPVLAAVAKCGAPAVAADHVEVARP